MAENEIHTQELPIDGVGRRLRNAREALGISQADLATRTKIAKRHLDAIEEDRFSDLAGRTYAVGFSRAYAREVGLDEKEVADAVRQSLARDESHQPPAPQNFEPGDPARVPPSRLAWGAGLGAVVIILLVFAFWGTYFTPATSLPDLPDQVEAEPEGGSAPAAGESDTAPAQGPVVFTALEPNIWVRFYDGSGERLYEAQMQQGESYTVPSRIEAPMIWTGRPDALQISIGGERVPRLADGPVTVRDRLVTPAALLPRGSGNSAPDIAPPAAVPLERPVSGPDQRPVAASSRPRRDGGVSAESRVGTASQDADAQD